MDVTIKNITEEHFSQSHLSILFSEGHSNRRFVELSGDNYSYLAAWQSDLIELVVVEISDGVYAIGVDQNFVVINFATNLIELKLELFYNFQDFSIINDRLLISTEMEIIELHKTNYQIIAEYPMPDIVTNIEVHDKQIAITCSNNEIIFLE